MIFCNIFPSTRHKLLFFALIYFCLNLIANQQILFLVALLVFVVRAQQDCQAAVNACRNYERYNISVAVYSQELVKQNQLILIDRMQSQLNEQATDNVNLQSQLLNQTAVDANLKAQLTNLTAERDKQNAIIANLTAERDSLKKNITDSITDGQYLGTRLLFDVRRSPTPSVPESYDWDQMVIVTYDKSITNIGNCMNIATGTFTTPYNGTYFFAWTGPNDEHIQRAYDSIKAITNDMVTLEAIDLNSVGNNLG